jgi:hypothetical protein
MTIPTPNPASVQITIGRGADSDFAALGVCPGDANFRERRRRVVDAVRKLAEPLPESREIQYLARTVIDGREAVLLCIDREGSTHGDRAKTTIVRGAFSPERAAELISRGNGLAPFAFELSSRRPAAKTTKNGDSANECRTEIAVAG